MEEKSTKKIAVFSIDVEEWYHLEYFKNSKTDKKNSVMDVFFVPKNIYETLDIKRRTHKGMKKIPNIRFDLYGMKTNQPVWADNYINAISQSKIGLNLSQGRPVKYYSSDRFAQLMGNGLLVMIDEKTKFNDFFSDKEIVFYKNIDDLSNKITKYSNDDKARNVIAKRGRDKYFKYFNSSTVAEYIINKSFEFKSKKYIWEK